MCLFFQDVLHLKKKDHMKWLLQFYHSEGGRNTAVHKGKKQRNIFSFIYCFRSKMKDSYMGHNRLSTTLKIFSLFQSVGTY